MADVRGHHTEADLLRRITRYYTSGAGGDVDVEQIGAFAVVFHRTSDVWYLSYATPVDALADDADEALAAVTARFAERERAVSLEWIEELAPQLADVSVRAGLPEPDIEPLLVVDRRDLRIPAVDGATVRIVDGTDESDVRAVRSVAHQTFPEIGPMTDAEVRRIADEIRAAQRVQVAVDLDGRPVAIGDHSPALGVTEITGVGTLPAYRRRGLAGLVAATLAADAFDRGCDVVYLTAATMDAARVYERVGFRRIGTARQTAHRPVF